MKKKVAFVIPIGLALAISCFLPVCAGTLPVGDCFEPLRLAIPGEGWQISFKAPPLTDKGEARRTGADYIWGASSGRFTISTFIEVPRDKGMTHKDCYEYYWARGSKNPAIAKESVTISSRGKYVRVQFDTRSERGGSRIQLRNVHYFFAYRGRWVDIHISVKEPSGGDEDIFRAFDETLAYGDSKSGMTE